MTKVSVIVPVYNTEEYLGECLDSLLMQTLEDIEVICVDDGSKDDSLSTLQTYAFLDERLTVLSQEHAGAAAARNKALAEAKGEFIYFANSYDSFDGNMLASMVQRAEEDASDVVIDGYNVFNQVFKEIVKKEQWDEKFSENNPCFPKDLSDDLFSAFPPVVWNKLIRADLIHKYKLRFDETITYCSDQAFNAMVLAGANKISLMNMCSICHRINFNPVSKVDVLSCFEDKVKAFSNLFYQLEKAEFLERFNIPYYLWTKNFIWGDLDALTTDKRADGLKILLKYFPDNVLKKLIFSEKDKIKISIIIPVYNASEFLSECLDSCLNQTLKDIEIICVNDGSTDDSLDILNEYAQKDARIKVISQDNCGRTIARNKAMEQAEGFYIQFLDADDWLEPDACKLLYAYARLFSLDMLSFSAIEFNHKTKEEFEEPYHALAWVPEQFPPVFTWNMITTGMSKLTVSACLTLYRRMFLLKHDICWLNKKVVFEDTPFFTEAAFRGARMGALKMTLYHRRVHSEATTQNMAVYFHDLIFIFKYTLNMLQRMNIPKPIIKAYANTFFYKVHQNYLYLDFDNKTKQTLPLYNFCMYMLRKYRLILPKNVENWLHVYVKSKPLKYRMKLKFYLWRSKLSRDGFMIPFLEFQKLPDFKIRVFGIPLISIQVSEIGLYSMTSKIFGIPFISVKEIQKNRGISSVDVL